MDKIRIIFAEDHVLVREGTRQLLDRHEDLEVVGEAADGIEAVELVRRLSPDLAILDIAMPRMGGIEATTSTSSRCWRRARPPGWRRAGATSGSMRWPGVRTPARRPGVAWQP